VSTVLNKLKNPLKAKGMLQLFTSVSMLSWRYSIVKEMVFDGVDFVLTNTMQNPWTLCALIVPFYSLIII